MRIARIILCLLVFSVGLAGCANRRCCKCSCRCQHRVATTPKSTGQLAQPRVVSIDSPILGSLDDSTSVDSSSKKSTPPLLTPEQIPVKNTAPPARLVKLETPPAVNARTPTIYGHADDYSWLKGQLQKVHVPGVEWKIRYSPVDQSDQWGGSMVLAPDIRLEDFADQDAVYISGEQLEERPSLYVTGPLYRIREIRSQKPIDQNSGRK